MSMNVFVLYSFECYSCAFILLSTCLLVYLQHFAVLLKYVIHVAIPDIPTWVREEMAKLDYQRREAFKVNYENAKISAVVIWTNW